MENQNNVNMTTDLIWKIILIIFRITMYLIGFTMMLWVLDEKLNVLSKDIFELYKIVPSLGLDNLKSAYMDNFWNMFSPGLVVALAFLPNILAKLGVSFFDDILSAGSTKYKVIEKDSGKVIKEGSSFFQDIFGSFFGIIILLLLLFALAFYVAPFIIVWDIIKTIIFAIRVKKMA